MCDIDANFGANTTASRSHDQFRQFFPAWRDGLRATLDSCCTAAAKAYYNPENKDGLAAYDVIRCLLDQTPNFRQAEMNCSSVILGLTPVLIQTLGLNTAQTSLLALRRPALAFLLSIGSPAVSPIRSTEYTKRILEFEDTDGWYPRMLFDDSGSRVRARTAVSLTLYVATLAAVANTFTLAYQLGYWSISVFAVQMTFLPLLWTLIALAIHLLGVAAFRFRVEMIRLHDNGQSQIYMFIKRLGQNLLPPEYPLETNLRLKKDSLTFYVLAWFLFIGVQVHVLFGVMLLASLMFISVTDALVIAARYCASAIVCRLVAVFELMKMHQNGLHIEKNGGGGDGVPMDETCQGAQSRGPSGDGRRIIERPIQMRSHNTWS